MNKGTQKIVIVGGGTAGWLTAAIIAAHHKSGIGEQIEIALIESHDIPTVGVGEGTWPTMKNTLHDIGVQESQVFRACHATFKQGGKFVDWVHGNGDFYYHPFTVPFGYGRLDLAPYLSRIEDYAMEANFQHHICEAGLAPRTLADGEYQGPANYAYHLDAGAFADFLKHHCRDKLGVVHIVDTVEEARLTEEGNIDALRLATRGWTPGDLFVDCTGFSSELLGKTLGVPFIRKDDILFNNTALAMQVPYPSAQSPIASNTIATAQPAGWIWDIGLIHRRGVGHVFSTAYISADEAEAQLRNYVGELAKDLPVKTIPFQSGHRKQFWKKNCVAVGLSAGFVEPLEATAIMLVEISARYIAENLPTDASAMHVISKRFNQQMDYRWQRIIDFLKLHYILTKRSEPYWQAHRDEKFFPQSLSEDLTIWQTRGPTTQDFSNLVELFPAASYQYVIYGMGFSPNFSRQSHLHQRAREAEKIVQRNAQITQQMMQSLPAHRQYIEDWLANSG